jgi:hypothetical protein
MLLSRDFIKDAARTGRGKYVFNDELEATIYERADGTLDADDLATLLQEEWEEVEREEDDCFSTADVYLRLAKLWRATLVRFD